MEIAEHHNGKSSGIRLRLSDPRGRSVCTHRLNRAIHTSQEIPRFNRVMSHALRIQPTVQGILLHRLL